MSPLMILVSVLFCICSVGLILIVLIQKGKGGGLSGALGGLGAGGVLGTKTGDFLTWVTITLAGLFLLLAVILAKFHKTSVTDYGQMAAQQAAQQAQQQMPVQTQTEVSIEDSLDAEADSNDAGN